MPPRAKNSKKSSTAKPPKRSSKKNRVRLVKLIENLVIMTAALSINETVGQKNLSVLHAKVCEFLPIEIDAVLGLKEGDLFNNHLRFLTLEEQ